MQVEFYWSPKGTSLVAHAVNDVSATNYYGDSHLYVFTTDGRVCKQIALSKDGPVHAVAWCTCSTLLMHDAASLELLFTRVCVGCSADWP